MIAESDVFEDNCQEFGENLWVLVEDPTWDPKTKAIAARLRRVYESHLRFPKSLPKNELLMKKNEGMERKK